MRYRAQSHQRLQADQVSRFNQLVTCEPKVHTILLSRLRLARGMAGGKRNSRVQFCEQARYYGCFSGRRRARKHERSGK